MTIQMTKRTRKAGTTCRCQQCEIPCTNDTFVIISSASPHRSHSIPLCYSSSHDSRLASPARLHSTAPSAAFQPWTVNMACDSLRPFVGIGSRRKADFEGGISSLKIMYKEVKMLILLRLRVRDALSHRQARKSSTPLHPAERT